MPNAGTVNNQPSKNATDGTNGNGSENGKTMPVVPFVRASGLHRETMLDLSRSLTSSDQDLSVQEVPAYGYLRSIVLHVKATGGDGSTTAATSTADAPFSALKGIVFQEPNGATLFQANEGYDLYIINKYGGYRHGNDPKQSPNYADVDSDGNFEFMLRIPLEISGRDGLGSLPNQDSAANFKIRAVVSAAGDIYSTQPGTLPSVRVKGYVETWDQPPQSTAGSQNQTTPPAVNTTQFWNPQSFVVNAGEQSPRLQRMGNYIRNLIFLFRDSSGVRTDDWPDPATLFLDARPKDVITKAAWRQTIYERYGYQGTLDDPGAQDTGVWPYDFCHEFDGKVGWENRDLWLPTLGSTRLEIEGNYPVQGTLYVLTNDISVAGVVFV